MDLQEETDNERVKAEVPREVDQGKKRKKKMKELLRKRVPQCGVAVMEKRVTKSSDEILKTRRILVIPACWTAPGMRSYMV